MSVLSQVSNCQGLGRKNKHEILKTDRISLTSIISIIVINVLRGPLPVGVQHEVRPARLLRVRVSEGLTQADS